MELWVLKVTLTLPAQPLGNIRVAPMPRGTRSYMGLSVGYRCIILEYAVMNISMLGMFIAPLPIWSYVGLGLGSRNVVMNIYR